MSAPALASAPPSESASGCFHCGLPVPADPTFQSDLQGAVRHFCCPGCQSVCEAIYSAGLEGFYQRTPEGQLLAPPPAPPQDLELLDMPELQQGVVRTQGDSQQVDLLVEGIHCAACVWLIERDLQRQPGVEAVEVNLANRKLRLRWHAEQSPLSRLVGRLAQIGYRAVPFDAEAVESEARQQHRALLFRIAFAGFAMMNMMWVAIALYSGADRGVYRELFHWVGLALATPTLFYSGFPFLRGAWNGLKARHLSMDVPIALGALATYLYSSYVTLSAHPSAGTYFDTVVNFIFVILVGRYLETRSRQAAVAAGQRLLDLQPPTAWVVSEAGERALPIRAVQVGDRVRIRPGDKVSVDGLVLEGSSRVDESLLSGESHPQGKAIGDQVWAGTLNGQGSLLVETQHTLAETALGQIVDLVEQAQASKAPIQCVADRVVPWFVSLTLLIAALTFWAWWHQGVETALLTATAVLIVTCPCAFGLATPMAIAVASGVGARQGMLVKNGGVLETLSQIDHVVLDKTGTLTQGKIQITREQFQPGVEVPVLWQQIASVEHLAEHPLARALVSAAHHPAPLAVEGFRAQPGAGVRGTVQGQSLLIGTQAWLAEHGVVIPESLQRTAAAWAAEAVSAIFVARDGEALALLGAEDALRDEALATVARLRQAGLGVTLLSGDRQAVVAAMAERLGGIDYAAEVLPQEKDQVVRQLQQQGQRVVMVGDGVNDAPALIRADVGIAIASGADVSLESADVVLMHEHLGALPQVLRLGRVTLRTVRQNIGLSILYNLIMVPLAVAGVITPLIAAISMPLSSLAVIGNSARIGRQR